MTWGSISDVIIAVSEALLALLAIITIVSARNRIFPSFRKVKGYQAVFLTNGQVYFGKIVEANKDYVELKYIYYLQTPLRGSVSTQGANSYNTLSETDELSLVKLGNELHGPEDSMFINQTQILFLENLKENGKVMAAVRSFEKSTTNALA